MRERFEFLLSIRKQRPSCSNYTKTMQAKLYNINFKLFKIHLQFWYLFTKISNINFPKCFKTIYHITFLDQQIRSPHHFKSIYVYDFEGILLKS